MQIVQSEDGHAVWCQNECPVLSHLWNNQRTALPVPARFRTVPCGGWGELLKQFDGSGRNQYSEDREGTLPNQKEVAESVGISEHQRKQAIRVANVPTDTFEAAVDAER